MRSGIDPLRVDNGGPYFILRAAAITRIARAYRLTVLGELKRRNVVRVGALYLLAAWLTLQVTELLFDLLELPTWSARLVFGLLVVGFPLVLLFSWVYELTPEGLKKQHEVDRDQSITARDRPQDQLSHRRAGGARDRRRRRRAVHSARSAHPGRNRCSARSAHLRRHRSRQRPSPSRCCRLRT